MLPDWLLWLLPVPLATLGAIAWVSWTSRTRRPQSTLDTVQDYERFRAALSSQAGPPAARQPGGQAADGGRGTIDPGAAARTS